MKKRKLIIILLILVMLFLIPSCKDTTKDSSQDAIKNSDENNDTKNNETADISFKDEYFTKESTSFSLDIAKFCALANLKYHNNDNNFFTEYSFEVVKKQDYDQNNISHTCNYLLLKKKLNVLTEEKELYLLILNTSVNNDWYSNFNFAPSFTKNEKLSFSENFLYASEDVYLNTKNLSPQDSLLLITGFSRGGACANLLGLLFRASHKIANTYVYTFASPNTINKELSASFDENTNVFNIVNKSDVITYIPFSSLGLKRLGTNIYVDFDKTISSKISSTISKVSLFLPSIYEYYTGKHSLIKRGKSDDGVSFYDCMCIISTLIINDEESEKYSIDKTIFLGISKESDLYVLVSLFTSNNQSNVLDDFQTNHNILTYQTLLEKTEWEEK